MTGFKNWKAGTAAAALAIVVALGAALWMPKGAEAIDIKVYRSPSCGCCEKWIDHLEENGFHVVARDTEDLTPIKQMMGVTPELASCHTAVVDGYVVEGHVPADTLKRFLQERPEVQGIAVPGMPVGSPGMEGAYKQPYDVVTFDSSGRAAVYERR